MTTVTAADDHAKLEALIDKAVESHEPNFITSERGNAVLLAEKDWRSILESLRFTFLHAMGKSIGEGLVTDLTECTRELKLHQHKR